MKNINIESVSSYLSRGGVIKKCKPKFAPKKDAQKQNIYCLSQAKLALCRENPNPERALIIKETA